LASANRNRVVAELDPSDVKTGDVLDPLALESRNTFPGWETPLAPWGCFNLPSGFSVVEDGGSRVLEWSGGMERALVTGESWWRDYSVCASIRPVDAEASPNEDRNDWRSALVGVVFRVVTSRFYYQFGVEGARRAVLYRRKDNEWLELAGRDIDIPGGYLDLVVNLDGDGIRCRCRQLGVDFFVTDTVFKRGKAGIRSMGRARCSGASVTVNAAQERKLEGHRTALRRERVSLGDGIPGPELIHRFELGDDESVEFLDFARPGTHDMLVSGGRCTRGLAVDGEVLWEIGEELAGILPSPERSGPGRYLYGFSGIRKDREMRSVVGGAVSAGIPEEVCLVRGDTGEVEARVEVPEMGGDVRRVTLTTHTGRLSAKEGVYLILREWSAKYGHGGVNLWAYDGNLEPLWDARVETPFGHGHALQFFDIDGDGRDEVLVGGTMFSPEGEVIWTHDMAEEMARIRGAQHYDAVAMGNLSGDPAVDPVAFLLGGSAGVYVLDGMTGRTRMVHRVGHAQGRQVGKVRGDLPGKEVLVACRWGNMGILTLFSGNGDRLWSIQPDYLGQGSCPVSWGARGEQLIWANTSSEVQGFYDGFGRRVKDLPEIRELYGNRMRRNATTTVVHVGEDSRDLLCLRTEDGLHVFGPGAGEPGEP